jgi:hypothetical protein
MSAPEDRDLLNLLLELIQYDFAEDDENVQGNWKITYVDNCVVVDYQPFPDSPFPAAIMGYRIERYL